MRFTSKTSALGFIAGCSICVFGLAAGTASAGIIYVNGAGGGANNGTSWANAFHDLQDALGAAGSGDEIWIAAGTYYPDRGTGDRTVSFVIPSGAGLYGGFAGAETLRSQANPTVNVSRLSGDIGNPGNPFDNSFHVVVTDNCSSATALDGLTISGGNASGQGGPPATGGGVLNQGGNPTITRCIFTGNQANFGAGIYTTGGSPTLRNCNFVSNSATTFGGGAVNVDHSPSVFVDCLFELNTAQYQGGGMVNANGANSTILNCTFRRNSVQLFGGGGVFNNTSSPLIANCALIGNSSASTQYGGGAIRNEKSNPTIVNCTIIFNSAGLAGGVDNFNNSSAVLNNCILFRNSDPNGTVESSQIRDESSIPVVNRCCIQGLTGGLGGVGNISADPRLIDALGPDHLAGTADDDLRLQPASPCVDAADNAAVPADSADLDGDSNLSEPLPLDLGHKPRFRDYVGTADTGNGTAPIVDMGANEFQPHCPNAGCEDGDIANNDCIIDLADLALLLAHYGANTHVLGDLDYDGDVDLSDVALMISMYGRNCN